MPDQPLRYLDARAQADEGLAPAEYVSRFWRDDGFWYAETSKRVSYDGGKTTSVIVGDVRTIGPAPEIA